MKNCCTAWIDFVMVSMCCLITDSEMDSVMVKNYYGLDHLFGLIIKRLFRLLLSMYIIYVRRPLTTMILFFVNFCLSLILIKWSRCSQEVYSTLGEHKLSLICFLVLLEMSIEIWSGSGSPWQKHKKRTFLNLEKESIW